MCATMLPLALASLVVIACSSPEPEPAPDIAATVAVMVAASEVPPTPNVQATVNAGVAATRLANIPTPSKPNTESNPVTQIVTTPTPVVPPTPTPPPFTEINFAGASYTTNIPNQIQVTFGLRDQNDRSIVAPPKVVENNLKVFERRTIAQEWEEIDYSETSYFIHAAENIDLEIVYVLDFTNSMYQARLPNGQNGIEAMLAAFDAAINVLSPTHRIGVVEFHDRNVTPNILSPLTSNRETIRQSVKEFSESKFDHGSSRVWDAVVKGITLFSDNRRTVRALVFLSDGRDTSSIDSVLTVAFAATQGKIQTYILGIGEVTGEQDLRSLAVRTNGDYHPVSDISQLQTALQVVVRDLRGQYQLSYITLRRKGEYETKLELKLHNLNQELEIGPFTVDDFLGPDNVGIITIDPASRDVAEGTTTYFVRARHMPRNIDRIRFKIDSESPTTVEFVPLVNGGLLDHWSLRKPDEDGYYEAVTTQAIEFGNFGLLFKVTIAEIAKSGQRLDLEFDNEIYGDGKKLSIGPTSYLGRDRHHHPNERVSRQAYPPDHVGEFLTPTNDANGYSISL